MSSVFIDASSRLYSTRLAVTSEAHAWLFRYQSTVSRRPSSKVREGSHPSSRLSSEEFMA